MKLVIDPLIFELMAHGGVRRLWSNLLWSFDRINCHYDLNRSAIHARVRRFLPYRDRTLFVPTLLRPALSSLSVQVMHDCTKERFYPRWKAGLIKRRRQAVLDSATCVVAVSEATRRDILAVYGERIHAKTVAIPNPVNADRIRALSQTPTPQLEDVQKWASQDRYALYVGTRSGSKNFAELNTLLRADNSIKVVIVGPPSTPTERHFIGNKLVRCRFVGPLPDEVLYSLMAESAFLFFPSSAEGFGYPVVEARALGIPTVGLSIPSNHEVGGQMLKTFQSGCEVSLRRAINEALKAQPSEGGEWPFDPLKVARRYRAVFETARLMIEH